MKKTMFIIFLLSALLLLSACSENIGGEATFIKIDDVNSGSGGGSGGSSGGEIPSPSNYTVADLLVTSDLSVHQVLLGDSFNFSFNISNLGNRSTTECLVNIIINDTRNSTLGVSPLLPSQSKKYFINIEFNQTGQFLISAFVDSSQRIEESDEQNNILSYAVTVVSSLGETNGSLNTSLNDSSQQFLPGVLIEADTKLNLEDSLHDVISSFAESDVEEEYQSYLADGTLVLDNNEVDFTQEMTVPDAQLLFGLDELYADDPVFYLDLSNTDFTYSIIFDKDVDFLNNMESYSSVSFFGSDILFLPLDSETSSLDLFKYKFPVVVEDSSLIEFSLNNASINLSVDELDFSSKILTLTVSSDDESTTKSLSLGEVKLFIDIPIFLSSINETSAELYVGGSLLSIPIDSFDNISDLDISGDLAYLEAQVSVVGDSWEDVSEINFTVSPDSLINPATNKKWGWLVWGESYIDPLFNFGLYLDNSYFEKTAEVFSFEIDNNYLDVTLLNELDEEFSFSLLYNDDGDAFLDDLVLNTNTLQKGDFFILSEEGLVDNDDGEDSPVNISRVYEVDDVTSTYVKLRFAGESKKFFVGDSIASATIKSITNGVVTLDRYVEPYFFTKNDAYVEFVYSVGTYTPKIYLIEDPDDQDEQEAVATAFYLLVGESSFRPYDNGWSDGITLGGLFEEDYMYSVSPFGSLFAYDLTEGYLYYNGELAHDVYVLFPNSSMNSSDSNLDIFTSDHSSYKEKDEDVTKTLFDNSDNNNINNNYQSLSDSDINQTTANNSSDLQNETTDILNDIDTSLSRNTLFPSPAINNPSPPVIQDDSSSSHTSSCQACFFDGQCLEKGFRLSSFGKELYCDGNAFVDQKKGGESCVDDAECRINSCVEVDSKGDDNESIFVCKRTFWEKIAAFFAG